MKKLLSTLFFLGLLASVAIGQGFITSHSIPIGQGPGVQGWGIGGPCATSQALVWPNNTSDPVCGNVGSGSGSTSPTTGQGAVVLQSNAYITTPTIASPTIVSAFTATGLVTNSDLSSSNIYINNTQCTLGSSCSFIQSDITSLKVGSTAITNGTSGNIEYNNNGTLGEYSTTGSPVNVVVLQSSPYIVTPKITSLNVVSAFTATGLVTNSDLTSSATVVNTINCVLGSGCTVPTNISSSPSITNNGVVCTLGGTCFTGSTSATTGQNNVVLQNSAYIITPTITSPTILSAFTATGLVTNSDLSSSNIYINNTQCTLGSSCSFSATVTSITVGTTGIVGATSGNVLNATGAILGQYPITGSNVVTMQATPYIYGATIASPTIVSAFTAIGLVTNADLANASTTPNGITCTLGSTCTLTASASSITTNGTSAYGSTTSRIYYSDNQKTVQQYAIQGNGTLAQMSSGSITTNDCVKFDVNGNTVDAGAACGSSGSSTGPTSQSFTTSGTATYTTPANVIWIEVRATGGGGGGGAVGGTTAPPGVGGGATTFGTNLITANGGLPGNGGRSTGTVSGGAGGTATVAGVAGGYAINGNGGGPGFSVGANGAFPGFGAPSCLGGGPTTATSGSTGNVGATNSGAGGGGTYGAINASAGSSGGGGSGGCVFAIIVTPSASYAIQVGGGGAGGVGTGTGALSGGAGAVGLIFVVEHYNH